MVIGPSTEQCVLVGDMPTDIEAAKQAKKPIENCVCIGDHLEHDVIGSTNAGMKGVWLNRDDKQNQSNVNMIKTLNTLMQHLVSDIKCCIKTGKKQND